MTTAVAPDAPVAPDVIRHVTLDDLALVLDHQPDLLPYALRGFIAAVGPAVACAPASDLANAVKEASTTCSGCSTLLAEWMPSRVIEGITTCGAPTCVDEVQSDCDLARQQLAAMRPACNVDPSACPVCTELLPSHNFVMAAGVTYCSQTCSEADRFRRAAGA